MSFYDILIKLHTVLNGLAVQWYATENTRVRDKAHTIKRINGKIAGGRLLLNSNALSFVEKSKLVIDKGGTLQINGDVRLYTNSYIHIGENAFFSIGNCTYINDGLKLSTVHHICIGDDCAISSDVTIFDDDFHSMTGQESGARGVEIGNHVWIGANVTILKSVHIGSGCVIGANSVVTKDIPDNCLAVGSPAKVIRNNVIWEK